MMSERKKNIRNGYIKKSARKVIIIIIIMVVPAVRVAMLYVWTIGMCTAPLYPS